MVDSAMHAAGVPTARWGPLAAVTLAVTLLAFGTFYAAFRAAANLTLSEAVTELVSAAPAPPVTPRRRVLLILVDGLRADVAWQLPFLRELTAAGARAELWVEPPSFSSAQYVAMLTGVPPRDSGVRTNRNLHPVALDNVPRRLAAVGRSAVEIGDEVDWWQRMFGADFTSTAVVPPSQVLGAFDAMAPADLTLVHLCEVDAAGHRQGGGSPSYREAAGRQDEQVRRLSIDFGWPVSTVVVMTDHGHMLAGGHGGDELDARQAWLIVSGPAARPGAVVPSARMVDVAPTLAALLGVAAPANAQGRTLLEILALDAKARAALSSADGTRIERAQRAAADGWRRRAAAAGGGRRMRAAALLLVVGLCGFALRRSWRSLRAGAVIGLFSLGLGVGLYFVICRRISFSAARSTSLLLVTTVLIGSAAAACAFGRAFLRAARRQVSQAEACGLGAGSVAGAGLVAALVFVYAGAFAPRVACEPGWVAVGPLIAYALFAPSVLAAAGLCGLALRRATRSAY